MAFLGIDLGSSSIKLGRLDLQTLQVDATQSYAFPEPVSNLESSRFEIEPAEVVRLVRQALDAIPKPVQDSLEGIVGSCQMGGLLAVDAKGRPLSRYLSWRDRRAGLSGSGAILRRTLQAPSARGDDSAIEVIRELLTPSDMRTIGHELRLGSMLVLAALQCAHGELTADALPLTLGDFVLMTCGRAAPATERTCALGTLDLKRLEFAQDVFQRLGIDHLRWPTLVDAMTPQGSWRTYDGRELPWYPFIGDHQASLLGVDLAQGDLSINVSTGSQVATLVETPEADAVQVRPYFDGLFLRTITHLPAGRALQAWVDLLSELAVAEGLTLKDPWQTIANATLSSTYDEVRMDLTLHDGPPQHRGSLTGLTLENLHIGSLFLAAFEDMADRYRACSERLGSSEVAPRLVLSGGLVRRFPQLQAAIVRRFPGIPVVMPESVESALEGLARLAVRVTHGTWPTNSSASGKKKELQ